MTDDSWRKRRDEETDFGPPLFGDDAATDSGSGGISFGDSDTGPLPHWTEPPTGEIPRVLTPNPTGEPTDDLDVWSSFSGQSPSSRDGFGAESSDGLDDITGLSPVFEQPDDDLFEDEPLADGPTADGGRATGTRLGVDRAGGGCAIPQP